MTDHLKALGSLHRRNAADARPLTDNQWAALAGSARSTKGTKVRAPGVPAEAGGYAWVTAGVLVRRGLAVLACPADGEGLMLTRYGTFRCGGRLHVTQEGRAMLRVVVVASPETLARIGKSDADEHGHYRDGRDPLDCGEYVDPEGLTTRWSTGAVVRKAEAEDRRARARRTRDNMRRAA